VPEGEHAAAARSITLSALRVQNPIDTGTTGRTSALHAIRRCRRKRRTAIVTIAEGPRHLTRGYIFLPQASSMPKVFRDQSGPLPQQFYPTTR
jgi:hypothetical protein